MISTGQLPPEVKHVYDASRSKLQIELRKIGVKDKDAQDIFIYRLRIGALENPTVEGVRTQFLATEAIVQDFNAFIKDAPKSSLQSDMIEISRLFGTNYKIFKMSPDDVQAKADKMRPLHPEWKAAGIGGNSQYIGNYKERFYRAASEIGVSDPFVMDEVFGTMVQRSSVATFEKLLTVVFHSDLESFKQTMKDFSAIVKEAELRRMTPISRLPTELTSLFVELVSQKDPFVLDSNFSLTRIDFMLDCRCF